MRIKCPYCGDRSLDEFVFQSEAGPARPDPDAASATADFTTFAYARANKSGFNDELWQHIAGCRAWLVVTRSASTHEISRVAVARDVARARRPAPDGDGA